MCKVLNIGSAAIHAESRMGSFAAWCKVMYIGSEAIHADPGPSTLQSSPILTLTSVHFAGCPLQNTVMVTLHFHQNLKLSFHP